MKLTEATAFVPMEVARDGDFQTLGFLSSPRPQMLAFCESPRYARAFDALAMPYAILTTAALAEQFPSASAVAVVDDPRRRFFDLHNVLARRTEFYGPPSPSSVDPTARVHPTAYLAAEDVSVGPRSVIGPHVTIQGKCSIGADVRIQAGAVLGADGFQFARFDDGVVDLVHAGRLEIQDHVVVHAGAVIARAVFHDRTVIGRWSRIGNLAFVSHNVQLGQRCTVGHGAVVNGSVVAGDDVVIGPGSTVSNCLRIGAGAHVTLGSAVIADVPAGQRVTGNVAIEHRRYLRHIAGATGKR